MAIKKQGNEGVNNRKGMPSHDHWQMNVSESVFPKEEYEGPCSAWLAKPGKDRPQPHYKINECDH